MATRPEYKSLMAEIYGLFERGRKEARKSGNHAQTRACWDIGKRILTAELNHAPRAEYGDKLLLTLAEDMTEKYGRGFSRRNLNAMVLFARTYKRTDLDPRLSWSQYGKLITIEDPAARKRLERQAIKEGMSYLKLRRLVRHENGLAPEATRPTGKLNTYRITRRKMLSGKTERYLDLGFGVYADLPENAPPPSQIHAVYEIREKGKTRPPELIPARPTELWLYEARVERIVDADTLIVLVKLLNNQHQRVRIRLAGVEIPERGTDEEEKARRYLTRKLKNAKTILLKTRGMDVYGRYIADVLYGKNRHKPETLLETGTHLNAELVHRQNRQITTRKAGT